ncbi:uncharacterized protein LOC120314243 isoform X1 [Crotalus tigris]|uniref:uncharacterized protein LOC120314243 isoform X1 n=2 Tax=Crotalus tigris TaxID=88082 RepID=UPI00192F298E|nr:uncharacterized protein LOC120314243 isoform X1 [Crotalus tigris]
MKFCLLNVLVEIILLRKGQAILVKKLTHKPGEEASFPCEAVGYHTHLFWLPLNPKCANTSTERVEINWNPARNEVIPLRFNQRLIYQPPQLLILKNLIMSDSGIYICRLSNGSETHAILRVTTGCHNNILVSSHKVSISYLKLNCQHCSKQKAHHFRWLLNSNRLGNRPWAKKSSMGSSVLLHAIQDEIWGRWECQSTFNPAWSSEFCLSPPFGEKDEIPEDIDSTEPTWSAFSDWSSPAVLQTTEVAQKRHAGDRIATWIWMLLLVGVVLIAAALSVTLYFWKKDFSDRCPHNNTARASGERMEHADFASVRNPIRKEKIGKQESLDERSSSLYYAQLQHLQGKSPLVQAPDNATVYAVIV